VFIKRSEINIVVQTFRDIFAADPRAEYVISEIYLQRKDLTTDRSLAHPTYKYAGRYSHQNFFEAACEFKELGRLLKGLQKRGFSLSPKCQLLVIPPKLLNEDENDMICDRY
jgi:hypothetical protein